MSPELPAGLGLGTIRQAVPFQCTIRVRNAVPSLNLPTAQMLRAESACTLTSSAAMPISGPGTSFQAEPVQCSINMVSDPPLFWYPTAHALHDDTTVTPCSTLIFVPESGGCAPVQPTQVAADAGLAMAAGSRAP